MSSKRSHKKSKNGCKTCRQRKIKCDETRPVCLPCRKHRVLCHWNSPNPAQLGALGQPLDQQAALSFKFNQPSSSPPWFGYPDRQVLELELMNIHTYIHATSSSSFEPRIRRLWAYEVPQRALHCDYLMSSILAYAAFHTHVHNPRNVRMKLAAHNYFGDAVRRLSKELPNITEKNAGLVFAASTIVAFHTSILWLDPCTRKDKAPYELPLQWFQTGQGVGAVVRSAGRHIAQSPMGLLVEGLPHRQPEYEPVEMLQPLKDAIFPSTSPKSSEEIDLDEACLHPVFRYIESMYRGLLKGEAIRITRRRILVFPTTLTRRYIDLLRAHDPRALTLLTYYFAGMKVVEQHWWIKGRADHEIQGMIGLLPQEWRALCVWPCMVDPLEWYDNGIPFSIIRMDDGQDVGVVFLPFEAGGAQAQIEQFTKPEVPDVDGPETAADSHNGGGSRLGLAGAFS